MQRSIEKTAIEKEVKNIVDVILRIKRKKRGENVNPTHIGKITNFKFILFSNQLKRKVLGMEPYLRCIEYCKREGIDIIFIMACYEHNIKDSEQFIKKIENQGYYKRIGEAFKYKLLLKNNRLVDAVHYILERKI